MLDRILSIFEVLRMPGGWTALVNSRPRSIASFRIASQLRSEDASFRTVIDGGANLGQFARAVSYAFPEAVVISIEPLPEICEKLRGNLADLKRHKIIQAAIGAADGEIEFRRNSYSQSSSVLPIREVDGGTSRESREVEILKVPLARIDSLIDATSLATPALLKLDLQGYELEALKGATETLRQCSHVLIETVFEQMYENEPLFTDLQRFLESNGFRFARPLAFLRNRRGHIVQMDALFRRHSDGPSGKSE